MSFIIKKIIRKINPPKIPKNPDGKILIHLGCGIKNDPRWINIDLLELPHIHYIQDIKNLNNFPNNYADLIYVSHALEHISHKLLLKVLKEWKRVLKPNAILRLSVPDFDKIISIYRSENSDIQSIIRPLMGEQDFEYNIHQSAFNKKYLINLLSQAGFKEIREWNPQNAPYHNFNDWSSKSISIKNKKYPISLNLEAVK